jgi:Cdc6-like AAA superfamily ATPase
MNLIHSHSHTPRKRLYTQPATETALLEELERKLRKPCGSPTLAHAAAVTGLGGTGKTQLVLNFIEQHKQEYYGILWIDARSEETIRSSFVRCCRTLNLPVEAASRAETSLEDSSSLQSVLLWLRSRTEVGQEWFVVMDNADEAT